MNKRTAWIVTGALGAIGISIGTVAAAADSFTGTGEGAVLESQAATTGKQSTTPAVDKATDPTQIASDSATTAVTAVSAVSQASPNSPASAQSPHSPNSPASPNSPDSPDSPNSAPSADSGD